MTETIQTDDATLAVSVECPPPTSGPHCAVAQAGDALIRLRVKQLLRTLVPIAPSIERRQDRRYPFPRLIRLTPVADDGRTTVGEPLVVVGNSLSERGIGFFHTQPLTQRKVVAAFASSTGEEIEMLVDLTWCRFMGQGWYESGGRFIQSLGTTG